MERIGSREVARAAIQMALTRDRVEEASVKSAFEQQHLKVAAVDFGGDIIASVMRIVERAVVAAKREGVIVENHHEEGAVAGATREAISQVMEKAVGLNAGGKIGVARSDEHVAVALFFGIGLLHLNEVAIGLGHRAV